MTLLSRHHSVARLARVYCVAGLWVAACALFLLGASDSPSAIQRPRHFEYRWL